MLNDIFRSFFRTLGRIIAYLFVGYLLMLLFGQINAKAATIEDYMEFGYYSNIGGKTFDNINQYYVINNGVSTTLTSKLVFDIYESIEYTPDKQDYYYFTLDYCSTGDSTIYDVYSSYENKIYGIFNTNQNCNSSTGTTGKIFKMFVKLKLSYIDTFDTDLKYSLYFTPSWGLNNKMGYNVFLRFLDMQAMTYDSFVDLYNQYSDKDLQEETNSKLDDLNDSISSDSEDTTSGSCGIICKLKGIFTGIVELPVKLVNLLIDALKSLFIPEDTDFITNFVESIESKLGFIAEVPVQIIEFGIDLASAGWEEVTSVSLPSISIFGYNFWSSQEIDISEGLKVFQAFRYITDCLCVIICARGLIKLWEGFTGGDSN